MDNPDSNLSNLLKQKFRNPNRKLKKRKGRKRTNNLVLSFNNPNPIGFPDFGDDSVPVSKENYSISTLIPNEPKSQIPQPIEPVHLSQLSRVDTYNLGFKFPPYDPFKEIDFNENLLD